MKYQSTRAYAYYSRYGNPVGATISHGEVYAILWSLYMAMLTAKRQRFWRYTQIIDRDNPFSSVLRTNLVPVPTPSAWNALFLAAAALDPLTV